MNQNYHRAFTHAAAAAMALILASCAEFSVQRPGSLRSQGSALVAVPLDAMHEGERFPGSGRETAEVVAAAFRKRLGRVDIMEGTAFANSMNSSGASQYDYLVIPVIVQWEDKTVKRREREDHVEIGIRVLRTRDGSTIAQWQVRKPSRVSTFFKASPAEQLKEPIDEYVREMFAREGR